MRERETEEGERERGMEGEESDREDERAVVTEERDVGRWSGEGMGPSGNEAALYERRRQEWERRKQGRHCGGIRIQNYAANNFTAAPSIFVGVMETRSSGLRS